MPVPQARHGFLTINGVTYPAYGASYNGPRNLVQGLPVGNTWGTNFAEGLKTSRWVGRIMVREKATEVLALAFWNLFLSRTFSGGFDDTAAVSLVWATGRRTRTMANAKAEAFTLTMSKGAPIGLTAVFVAPAPASMADQTPTTYGNTFDNSPPLMFDKATFGGITGSVYGCEITYANNHQPNGPLDATKVLSSWDAGLITCGCRLTFAEHLAASEPFADAANLTIALAGATTRNLSLTAVTPNDPHDVPDSGVGQVYQTYNCIVQGSASVAPLVVT